MAEKPKRRQFTAEYKLRILQEADACTEPGEVGALLRREGLYSSHLSDWRALRRNGSLSALKPKKRGRKPKEVSPEAKRVAELERELRQAKQREARLEAKLKRADLMLDLQKKAHEILGIELPPAPPPIDGSDS